MALLQACLEHLTTEAAVLQKLLNLGHKKQTVLLKGAVAELAAIVAQEEILLKEAEQLEQLRVERFSELTGSLGLPLEATLAHIAAACPREESLALREKGEYLSGLIQELQILNRENSGMINQSLDLVRFSLRSIVGRQEAAGYTPVGEQKQSLNLLLDKRV